MLNNIKFWQVSISTIRSISSLLDKKWQKIARKIDTFFLIIFISKLVLQKSRTGYQIIIDEIWNEFKKNNIKLPQEKPFAQSSVCEARQKLSPNIILEINNILINGFYLQMKRIYFGIICVYLRLMVLGFYCHLN